MFVHILLICVEQPLPRRDFDEGVHGSPSLLRPMHGGLPVEESSQVPR